MSGVGLQEEHEIRSRFIKLSITLKKLSLSNSYTQGLDYCNLFFFIMYLIFALFTIRVCLALVGYCCWQGTPQQTSYTSLLYPSDFPLAVTNPI